MSVIKVTLAAGWGKDAWRRPMETTLVAQGRVAWADEVALRWRDREALETCFSTWVPGIDGLDMGVRREAGLGEEVPAGWRQLNTLNRICPPRFPILGLYICLFLLLSAQFVFGGAVEAVILFPLPNSGSLHKLESE